MSVIPLTSSRNLLQPKGNVLGRAHSQFNDFLRRYKVRLLICFVMLLFFVVGFLRLTAFQRDAFQHDTRLLFSQVSSTDLESVVFSPNGRLLATSTAHGEIQLRNTADGVILRTMQGHTRAAALAFSPDGRLLVSASSDGTIKLWQADTGAMKQILWTNLPDPSHALTERDRSGQTIIPEGFISVAFSPDGSYIAVGSDRGRIIVLETSTNTIRYVWQGYTSAYTIPVYHVEISKDNQLLLSVARQEKDGGVKLWHLPEQKLIQSLLKGTTTALSYSPGWGVFDSAANQIRTFDEAMRMNYYGQRRITLSPDYDIWSVDGRMINTVSGQTVAGQQAVSFEGEAYPTSFAVSPDLQILAWGGGVSHNDNDAYRFLEFNSDPRIIVWRLDKPQTMFTLTGHRDNVTGLAFSSDGKLLASISYDNMLCLWRISE